MLRQTYGRNLGGVERDVETVGLVERTLGCVCRLDEVAQSPARVH